MARYELDQGRDPKKVLDERWLKFAGTNLSAQLAIGELGLEKGDYDLAAEYFRLATTTASENPDGYFGLCRALAPSDNEAANAAIRQALQINPNHIPSLLYLAENKIDEEDFESAGELLRQVMEINSSQPDGLAFLAVIAHLDNEPEEEARYRSAALEHWKGNPRVDYLIGKKLSQKYRFAEAAAYQRRALVYDSGFLPAKLQLTQDLLRLGDEEEGWRLADEVNSADGYSVLAYNLVALRANIAEFATIERGRFCVANERSGGGDLWRASIALLSD